MKFWVYCTIFVYDLLSLACIYIYIYEWGKGCTCYPVTLPCVNPRVLAEECKQRNKNIKIDRLSIETISFLLGCLTKRDHLVCWGSITHCSCSQKTWIQNIFKTFTRFCICKCARVCMCGVYSVHKKRNPTDLVNFFISNTFLLNWNAVHVLY